MKNYDSLQKIGAITFIFYLVRKIKSFHIPSKIKIILEKSLLFKYKSMIIEYTVDTKKTTSIICLLTILHI